MAQVIKLASYGEDQWLSTGEATPLISAVDSSTVAIMPGQADSLAMLQHARSIGTRSLQKMTFQERGRMLRAMAEALTARKDELYELSYNTGATKGDSAFDIEGGIGTLFVYASKAKSLPNSTLLPDGQQEAITKGNFVGQHFLSPLSGTAIHINAYNFPVWGMLEKLGPTLLAGMPAIIKPATTGAYLTHAAFKILIESGVIPDGALQLYLGTPVDIFDHLDGQDVVSFTGSADTAAKLKTHPTLVREAVRFASEQDSLNSCILGPSVTPDSPEFSFFIKEIIREMTQKAGQKCTAIRRIFVPTAQMDLVADELVKRLAATTVGDPRDQSVRMGALASLSAREDTLRKLDMLKLDGTLLTKSKCDFVNVDSSKGAFVAPALLRCDTPHKAINVHKVEAFGPVTTLMPYTDLEDACNLIKAGKGSLVCSAFGSDSKFNMELFKTIGPFHGRIMIADSTSASDSTGHGAALPHLLHGGPGRAGGAEELGGIGGMKHYMQKTALQASPALISSLIEVPL